MKIIYEVISSLYIKEDKSCTKEFIQQCESNENITESIPSETKKS